VARESHAQPDEGFSPVRDARASEVRRKPWWGEAVGGDVAHTRQEGPWRLQWTLGERAVVGSTTTVGGHGGRRRTH